MYEEGGLVHVVFNPKKRLGPSKSGMTRIIAKTSRHVRVPGMRHIHVNLCAYVYLSDDILQQLAERPKERREKRTVTILERGLIQFNLPLVEFMAVNDYNYASLRYWPDEECITIKLEKEKLSDGALGLIRHHELVRIAGKEIIEQIDFDVEENVDYEIECDKSQETITVKL